MSSTSSLFLLHWVYSIAMKEKLVVFDLDGTLLDTLPDIAYAINYALSAWDIEPLSLEGIRRNVGHGLRNALLSSVRDSGKTVEESEMGLMYELMMNTYAKHPSDHTVPYTGIVGMLESLQKDGVKLGILSNKSDDLVKRIVAEKLPSVSFSFVLGQCAEYPLKPDPTSLLAMVSETGTDLSDTVYVGDSEVDWKTAENAGVRCLIVSYGFRTSSELMESGIEDAAESVGKLASLL
ncbi:MAG: HAD family hydrolase [Candidatus Ornithospirochaeta sp.]